MTPACLPGQLDADAIELALSRLPARLEADYASRLASLEPGIVLELALIGRLLQKTSPFEVTPWPEDSRADVHLRKDARVVEVEIKTSISTLYDRNVEKMCLLVQERMAHRWPDFKGEVHLCNQFREKEVRGQQTLDIEGTADDVMAELLFAIDEEGNVRNIYKFFEPFRLVTKIGPLPRLKVWHSSSTLPGGHGQAVIARTLKRALDDKNQFSGRVPAVVALIQARDPDARLLHWGSPSVADEFFDRHTKLSAIIAVPCPSLNGTAVLISADDSRMVPRLHPLSEEEKRQIIELFTVQLMVHPVWIGLEEELRRRVMAGEDM